MAFGSHIAKAGAAAQRELLAREVGHEEEGDTASPASRASTRSAPASSEGSGSQPPPSTAALPNVAQTFGRGRGGSAVSRLAAEAVSVTPQARPNMGALRLNQLMDIVSNFQMLDGPAREALKKDAKADAEGVLARLEAIYKETIEPARQKRIASLDAALALDGENEVVSLFIKGTRSQVKKWPRDTAKGFVLLHGATVESVAAAQTPFPAPSVLFARPAEEVRVVVEDAAFEGAAGSRPRP